MSTEAKIQKTVQRAKIVSDDSDGKEADDIRRLWWCFHDDDFGEQSHTYDALSTG